MSVGSTPKDNTPLAVAAVVFTVFALALGDAVVKNLSSQLTLWQIFSLRSAMVVPLMAGLVAWRFGKVALWPKVPRWTIVRSLLLTGMWIVYYLALPHIALSTAAAAYYTLPLFIALFGARFLAEPVGWLGWVAIGIGFVGVVMILKPDADDFSLFALLPLVSAVCYALAMILTRSKCRNEEPFVLSLWLNLVMLGAGVLGSILFLAIPAPQGPESSWEFLLGDWAPMDTLGWLTIALLAVTIIIGSVGAAVAYQLGRPSTVATFDFAYVGFAVVWGYLLFNEIPDSRSIVGMMLIVVAGIMAIRKPSGST